MYDRSGYGGYLEAGGGVLDVPDVVGVELVTGVAGVAAGAGDTVVDVVAVDPSFAPPVFVPSVLPPELEGGFILSE